MPNCTVLFSMYSNPCRNHFHDRSLLVLISLLALFVIFIIERVAWLAPPFSRGDDPMQISRWIIRTWI